MMGILKKYGVYYFLAIVQGILLWYFVDTYRTQGFEFITAIKGFIDQFIDQGLYRQWFPITIVLAIPTLLYFIKEVCLKKQIAIIVTTFTVLLGIHLYITYTADIPKVYVFVPFQCLALLLVLPFLQLSDKLSFTRITYTDYFDQMISNISVAIQALIILPVLAMILWLCHALLSLINITFIEDCLDELLFICIAGAIYAASAIMLPVAKKYTPTLSYWLLAAMSGIFIVLSIAVALFLIFLPFQGLSTLWEFKIATPVLLTTQVVMLVLFNISMREGSKATTIPWLRYFTLAIIAVLPVLTGISLYSIGLRIYEYGFTPPRIWLLIAVIIAGVFSMVYSILIISRKLDRYFGKVNLLLILLTAFIAFLLATPVLDARRISANSQLNRLLEKPKDGLDVTELTLFSSYGYYGIEALNRLKETPAFSGYAEDIDKVLSKIAEDPSVELFTDAEKFTALKTVSVYPAGTTLDDNLYQTIVEKGWLTGYYINRLSDDVVFLMVDLNQDQRPELVIITRYLFQVLHQKADHQWVNIATNHYPDIQDMKHLKAQLQTNDFSAVAPPPPVLQDLRIGEQVFSVEICCDGYDIADKLSSAPETLRSIN